MTDDVPTVDELLYGEPFPVANPMSMPRHPWAIAAEDLLRAEAAERRRARDAYQSEEARATRRLWRNMMLSGGDLEICEALCRGESVPIELLDQAQVRRFGLR